MILPIGSLINATAIVVGAGIGMLLGDRLPGRMRESVFQGLGLCTMAIGMSMTLKTQNPLYVIGSILVGIIIGEALDLEGRINRGGEALKRILRSRNGGFTEGFVSASLLFCIGSMAIIGPLNEGLSGDKSIVLTKTMLDFFASIAFGAVYGSGVMASALPLLIYQGSITLFAEGIRPYLNDHIRAELEATGGIAIMGIGLNLLGLLKIRLSNFLPALLVVVLLCLLIGSLI
ncbi:DUF554 domain-containing protein [Desulfovibrio cuneatus]|uniref:DUF554 domain-containing protein n=1 Tax=Desulfovibrio cuneatus TaxID=159728 RepID=UPI000405792C|nr:DUF554 domain-containing protein [Desulfovibrio cuneatus]